MRRRRLNLSLQLSETRAPCHSSIKHQHWIRQPPLKQNPRVESLPRLLSHTPMCVARQKAHAKCSLSSDLAAMFIAITHSRGIDTSRVHSVLAQRYRGMLQSACVVLVMHKGVASERGRVGLMIG